MPEDKGSEVLFQAAAVRGITGGDGVTGMTKMHMDRDTISSYIPSTWF